MMRIRAVQRADQDIGVEDDLQRSSSSASSRSRYPGGYVPVSVPNALSNAHRGPAHPQLTVAERLDHHLVATP